jgi:cytosine/adenosine deaminase-related metal-dependent hydrolase
MNGARALGMQGRIGELSPRCFADLISIPFEGKAADIYEAALHHKADVAASMIDGRWVAAPRQ